MVKKKKTYVEPVLLKHKEKLDEITKFYDMGSHGADTGNTGTGSRRNGKRGKCPLGFK